MVPDWNVPQGSSKAGREVNFVYGRVHQFLIFGVVNIELKKLKARDGDHRLCDTGNAIRTIR